jgi:hypothetical protein
VCTLEPDLAQVPQGRGTQVTAEGQLDRADRDERGGRDVGDADVVTRPLLDERDGASHGPGCGVGLVDQGCYGHRARARVMPPPVPQRGGVTAGRLTQGLQASRRRRAADGEPLQGGGDMVLGRGQRLRGPVAVVDRTLSGVEQVPPFADQDRGRAVRQRSVPAASPRVRRVFVLV